MSDLIEKIFSFCNFTNVQRIFWNNIFKRVKTLNDVKSYMYIGWGGFEKGKKWFIIMFYILIDIALKKYYSHAQKSIWNQSTNKYYY